MTAPHNAASVALAVMERIERPDNEAGEAQINAMQIQKLVYYCQAYFLAIYGRPLFHEDVEAWVHGPVVRELWKLHSGHISITAGELRANAERNGMTISALDDEEEVVVEAVCETLGGLTGWQLRNRTHEEAPWIDNFVPGERPHSRVIPHPEMQRYYRDL